MSNTVADVMIATLKASGVRRVYRLPGDSINGSPDGLRRGGRDRLGARSPRGGGCVRRCGRGGDDGRACHLRRELIAIRPTKPVIRPSEEELVSDGVVERYAVDAAGRVWLPTATGACPGGYICGMARSERRAVSHDLQRWLDYEGEKTLGSIIELFEEKSFALLFILLLGVSALPLPTGGATHVFEIVAIVLAVQLIAGRDVIWLPQRWRKLDLGGPTQRRFLARLMHTIRWLERLSRPRLSFLFDHRAANFVFGVLVVAGTIGAFLAPPFSGLDTLPSMGVVLLSLGVLLEDFAFVVVAIVIGAAGVFLEIVLGRAVIHEIKSLF